MEKPGVELSKSIENISKIRSAEKPVASNKEGLDFVREFMTESMLRNCILLAFSKEQRPDVLRKLNKFFKENPELDNFLTKLRILSMSIEDPGNDLTGNNSLSNYLESEFVPRDSSELDSILEQVLNDISKGPSGAKWYPSYDAIHRADQDYNGDGPGSYNPSWE